MRQHPGLDPAGRHQPGLDPSLWNLASFADGVAQVRQARHLASSTFVPVGQSRGGLLALDYAVDHRHRLRALVIFPMMSSSRLYTAYANDGLMPATDQTLLAEIGRL